MTAAELQALLGDVPPSTEIWVITDCRTRVGVARHQTLKEADPQDLCCGGMDEPTGPVVVLHAGEGSK